MRTNDNMQGLDGNGVRLLLWDFWTKLVEHELPRDLLKGYKNFYYIAKDLCLPDVEDFYVEIGTERFSYDCNYFVKCPEQTMTHLWHDEAGLQDAFLCREHGFFMKTSTMDGAYIEGQSPYCPDCNADAFLVVSDGMQRFSKNAYVKAVSGEYLDPEIMRALLEFSKRDKKFWNKYQAKDDWKQFVQYLKQKVGL